MPVRLPFPMRCGDYATGILRECPGLCRSIGQNESLFGLSVVDNARTDQVFVALLDVESVGYGFEREFDSCIITACQRQCLFGFVIRVSGGESLTVIGESRNQLKTVSSARLAADETRHAVDELGHFRDLVVGIACWFRTAGGSLRNDPWWLWVGVSFVGIYSGYFGAAAGTLALAILDLGKIGPFHQINALKTVVGFGANISAAIMFIIRGSVYWPFAIAMCLGCIIGSSIAPPVTRHISENIMRAAAVLTGIILAVKLGWSTYF